MTQDTDAEIKMSDLRRRAESALEQKAGDDFNISTLSTEDAPKLVHELQVHQIELEMQKQELRETQLALQASRDNFSAFYDFGPVGYVTSNAKGLILAASLTSVLIVALLSLLISISVPISAAYSSENNTSIKPGAVPGRLLKTIIVPDYYPYTFLNDAGMPDGFAVDVARAVVQAMDMKLEISVDTWEHAVEALQNGTIDFLPMMASSPLRRQSFDFSVPHTIAYDAVFVRRDAQRITSLDDLAGKTVIVMNKDAAHDFISETSISDKIKLLLVDSLPDGIRLLASGKGDAAIMPKLVGFFS
jgi:ABC-type amino acid transport substrate-binding protein